MKKNRPKNNNKPDKKKLDDQCLDLWALIVKKRDFTCRNCNSTTGLSGHHIRVRQHKSTRYDVDNGVSLCRSCHSLQKFRPEQFHDMVIEIIGQKEYDRLKAKSEIEVHYKIPDLLEIKEHLKSILNQMEG